MSYLTVKNGIIGILKALGYSESSEAIDFVNAPANEYGNTFIIRSDKGELREPDSETLSDRFYDNQTWTIQIAQERSSQNDIINLDKINLIKDEVIKEIDDPASWRTFVRFMKYSSWNIQATDNYYILTVEVNVQDVYTY